MKCPHCKTELRSVRCPHCSKRISVEQSGLLSAVARQLAKPGGVQDTIHAVSTAPLRPDDGYCWEYTSRDSDAMASFLSVVRRKLDTFEVPSTPEGRSLLRDAIQQLVARVREVEVQII